MAVAIKFENISKQYRLGSVGTGTLSHDLNRWWKMNIRGEEDPYLKIGSVNNRDTKAESDYVWALRDINFEVQQGEVLGIIGKNGAGKSTLLKILSRVTSPSTGTIKSRGRIASLLEVGTGFHPEMTGRENIFMNGAIMGMTKAEIRRKMDQIVDFAGIERYIDTPVKRYSSGMTVRLGFAVAAHLEPEILVVDEVLAVGDAEFQKKAIGKMQDISKGEGRTVLFVSHNMGAVKSLCNKGIVLKDGEIAFQGFTPESISFYLNENQRIVRNQFIDDISLYRRSKEVHYAQILSLGFVEPRNENIYATIEPIKLFLIAKSLINNTRVRVAGSIYTSDDQRIGLFFSKEYFVLQEDFPVRIDFEISNHNLSIGQYYISLSIGTGDHTTGNTEFDILYEVICFEVQSESQQENSSVIMKWNRDWGNILFPVTAYVH